MAIGPLASSIGLFILYLLGTIMSWRHVSLVCAVVPIVILVVVSLVTRNSTILIYFHSFFYFFPQIYFKKNFFNNFYSFSRCQSLQSGYCPKVCLYTHVFSIGFCIQKLSFLIFQRSSGWFTKVTLLVTRVGFTFCSTQRIFRAWSL